MRVNTTYINSIWLHLHILYLLACQVRVTVGDSGLCCVCVASFDHLLTPLCADSAHALWASFCFRLFTWDSALESTFKSSIVRSNLYHLHSTSNILASTRSNILVPPDLTYSLPPDLPQERKHWSCFPWYGFWHRDTNREFKKWWHFFDYICVAAAELKKKEKEVRSLRKEGAVKVILPSPYFT